MTNPKFPKAYLHGRKDFYGRDFFVSSDVLIPRPETEQLIDLVFSLAGKTYLPGVKSATRRLSDKFTIIDVGTGSGCIATTLALEFPEASVFAVDVSEKALAVARRNADELGTRVEFLRSDLLDGVPDMVFRSSDDLVIVANLPYVDSGWEWLDKEALGYEPELALYAEDGGLALYKRLFSQISEKALNAFVIIEADPCQHEELIKYAKNKGFKFEKRAGFGLLLKWG